jgi:hypothetical protein
MPPLPHVPASAVLNPILLWILIHGGDPAPDQRVGRLSAALAIQSLASHLEGNAAKEIHAVAAKEIVAAANAAAKA